jgi:Thymidylate synthase complementing protein.
MITVKLISKPSANIIKLISFAAKTCYNSALPKWGKMINVKNDLFLTGHHTTFEHGAYSFAIEGIDIGSVTFGLHLTNPFYNSDQRSGRFCAKFFTDPNIPEIHRYIKKYWPNTTNEQSNDISLYLAKCFDAYEKNMPAATELAKKFIKEERPNAGGKYAEKNSAKFAQEQLRNFTPIISPTALLFSADLITIASLYEEAWSPVLREVLEKMADEIKKKSLFGKIGLLFNAVLNKILPDKVKKTQTIDFVFNQDRQRKTDWSPIISEKKSEVLFKPRLKILNVFNQDGFVSPTHSDMHPVDRLQFMPEMMNDKIGRVTSLVEVSCATYGQDQRHRTIERGTPILTGNFYLPPLAAELHLENLALDIINSWKQIAEKVPGTLAAVLAPYGATVEYQKSANFLALAHEQAKRECFCTQEEIFHLNRLEKLAMEELFNITPLSKLFEPICYDSGICGEGLRYCGRDIKLRNTGDYFPERKI